MERSAPSIAFQELDTAMAVRDALAQVIQGDVVLAPVPVPASEDRTGADPGADQRWFEI